jgi:hypothetical protein
MVGEVCWSFVAFFHGAREESANIFSSVENQPKYHVTAKRYGTLFFCTITIQKKHLK